MKRNVMLLMMCLVLLVSGVLSGCGKSEEGENVPVEKTEGGAEGKTEAGGNTELEEYTFGIIYNAANVTTEMYTNFFENFVGPEFNVKFVLADPTTDVSQQIAFVENLASMGGSVVIDFAAKYEDEAEALVAKCDELGIYYVANNTDSTENLHNYEYFGGLAGSQVDVTASQFAEMTEYVFGDGKDYNIVLMNALTQTEGQHYSQHGLTNMAILETFKEMFGWEYPYEELWDICKLSAMEDVDTGTEQILRTCPSYEPDPMYQAIKNGDINGIISSGPMYTFYEAIVSEVEQQYGIDIKQISIAAMADTTRKSFEQGTIDAVLLKNAAVCGSLFIQAYNCASGHPELTHDVNDPNGAYYMLDASMWVCKDLETYDNLSKIDAVGSGYYSWTIDEIKDCLYVFNPDITHAEIVDNAKAAGEVETVLEKNGL